MANYNPNRAKVNRNYSFEELASLFCVHKNTVAHWVKNGLPCLKDQRPFLVLGADVRTYLQGKRVENRQKCKPNELFCLCCKKPTKPALNFVEYIPASESKGRLVGLCRDCSNIINKFVGLGWLAANLAIFDVSLPKELEHIRDTDKATLNSDFNQ